MDELKTSCLWNAEFSEKEDSGRAGTLLKHPGPPAPSTETSASSDLSYVPPFSSGEWGIYHELQPWDK